MLSRFASNFNLRRYIGGVCVGKGLMGKDTPAGQVLGEYVGNVMTEDEFRRGGSQMYGVDLTNPLGDVVIDAGMRVQGAGAAVYDGRVTCMMAKLNDTRIIRPRHDGPTASLPSNAEGNAQLVCADGPEANCCWVIAQCDGCKAHDAAVLAALGLAPLGPAGTRRWRRRQQEPERRRWRRRRREPERRRRRRRRQRSLW